MNKTFKLSPIELFSDSVWTAESIIDKKKAVGSTGSIGANHKSRTLELLTCVTRLPIPS